MVREKSDNIEDGAAETMLGGEKESLAKKDEVKFISADHKNGDAKIDIGSVEKVNNAWQKYPIILDSSLTLFYLQSQINIVVKFT